MKRLQLRGEATVETVAEFVAAVEQACREAGAQGETLYAVKLAVEEVCLNVVNHGYKGAPGPLSVDLEVDEEKFVVTIVDEAPPFAPEDAPPADTTSSVEDRKIGGYGWFLVKEMMDRLEHSRGDNGGNRLRLTKLRSSSS